MSISQQVIGGNSCGACAASYVLEQIAGKSFTAEKIRSIWANIQFGDRAREPVQSDHTDPTKLSIVLQNNGLAATPYMATSATFLRDLKVLVAHQELIREDEGMDRIRTGYRLSIGIYSVARYRGLHYILTKFDYANNCYSIMDSNDISPHYVETPVTLSANQSFYAEVNFGNNTDRVMYQYLGAGILVSRHQSPDEYRS